MLDEPHRKAVFARWSPVAIIATGLLLIVMQLAAQIVIDLELLGKKGGNPGSYYVGLVVLLIGAAFMSLISLSDRPHQEQSRADRARERRAGGEGHSNHAQPQ
jgi:putative copper export protein